MERLDKFLCDSGAGTRSQVKLILKAGRVTVDGKVLSDSDIRLIEQIKKKNIPYAVVFNKCDTFDDFTPSAENEIAVSAEKGININELRELIAKFSKSDGEDRHIVSDLISPSDFIVLVVPIDKAAPKGRLILPQQQTIRDILDTGASAVVVRDNEYADTLAQLGKKPSLVITDSQVFGRVSAETPADIKLTSFSILMARYKGVLSSAAQAVKAIDVLQDGDSILISEGCTHHRQCGDIGTVKLPAWIKKHSGKDVNFCFTSGTEFPEDLTKYKLIVHCGGCMLNEREMKYRQRTAAEQGIPMTNYGILIAHMNGILKRSTDIIPELYGMFD